MNYQGRGRYNRGGRGPPRRQNTRSFGRGNGRGFGRGRSNSNFSTSYPEKIYKFAPHAPGRTNFATYASTKEKVIQYAQENLKNGHDMVKSLKQGKLIDIKAEEPKRIKSTETDAVKKAEDQKGLDIKYEAELNRHMERRDVLMANVSQMFAVIQESSAPRS